MDVATVQEILKSAYLRCAFEAFLVTAREQGETVQTLASVVGVSKRTMYRYLAKLKAQKRHSPYVEIHDRPVGDQASCSHGDAFFVGRKRVCIRCLASNLEADLRRQRINARGQEQRDAIPPAEFLPKGSKKAKSRCA